MFGIILWVKFQIINGCVFSLAEQFSTRLWLTDKDTEVMLSALSMIKSSAEYKLQYIN